MAFLRLNGIQVPVREFEERRELVGQSGRSLSGTAYRTSRATKRSWQAEIGPLTPDEFDLLRRMLNNDLGDYWDLDSAASRNGQLLPTLTAAPPRVPLIGDDGYVSKSAAGWGGGELSSVVDLGNAERGMLAIRNKNANTSALTSGVGTGVNDGSDAASTLTEYNSPAAVEDVSGSGWYGSSCYRLRTNGSGATAEGVRFGSMSSSTENAGGVWLRNPTAADVDVTVSIFDGSTETNDAPYTIPANSDWIWCETDQGSASGTIELLVRETTAGSGIEILISAPVLFAETSLSSIGPVRGDTLAVRGDYVLPDAYKDHLQKGGDWTMFAWFPGQGAVTRTVFSIESGSNRFYAEQNGTGDPGATFPAGTDSVTMTGSSSEQGIWVGVSWDFSNPTSSIIAARLASGEFVSGTISNASNDLVLGFDEVYVLRRGNANPSFSGGFGFIPRALDADQLEALAIGAGGYRVPTVALEGDAINDEAPFVTCFAEISDGGYQRRHRGGSWRNNDRFLSVEFFEL